MISLTPTQLRKNLFATLDQALSGRVRIRTKKGDLMIMNADERQDCPPAKKATKRRTSK
jgi:hypothetical protein